MNCKIKIGNKFYTPKQAEQLQKQGTIDPKDIEVDTGTSVSNNPTTLSILVNHEQVLEKDETSYTLGDERLNRVTDDINGGMAPFMRKPKNKNVIEFINDTVFEKVPEGQTKFIRDLGRVTKEEHKEHIEKQHTLGKIKGNIVHTIVSKVLNKSEEVKNNLQGKINDLYAQAGIAKPRYSWVESKFGHIASRIGINHFDKGVEPQDKDKVFSEVRVGNKIFKLGGAADLLVEHSDGTYSIFDFKTSSNFWKEYPYASILKYGVQGVGKQLLIDNHANRAKLQIMLYALLFKANNPEMKFRHLRAVILNHKESIYGPELFSEVQVSAFLKMIEQYLSNERPEVLEALKQDLGETDFKKLWDPTEYNNGYTPKVKREIEMANNGIQATKDKIIRDIRHAIYYDLAATEFSADEDARSRARDAVNALEKYLELIRKTTDTDLTHWNEETMSIVGSQLYSGASANSVLMQHFNKLRNDAKNKAEQRYQAKYRIFRKLVEPIKEDYLRTTGKLGWDKTTAGKLTHINYAEMYGWLYLREEDGQYRLRLTDAEFDDLVNSRDYPQITASNVKNYKRFARFLDETFAEFFVGENALANQEITWYVGKNGKKISLTNLQVANGMAINSKYGSRDFTYSAGFFPKVPRRIEEYGYFTKARAAEAWKRASTN